VHLAPAFGEDDAEVGRREGLPVLNPVDAEGTFDHRVAPWNGLGVRQANPAIVTTSRCAASSCGRSRTSTATALLAMLDPLIYWAKTSWFARTSERRDDLLAQNQGIHWYPEHIKEGRFGKWLEHNVDWGALA